MGIPARDADVVKKYQLTNLINNNNKYWSIEWWKSEAIAQIIYGRVGQVCVRPAIKENITEAKFNKLLRDREKPKTEGTYKEIIMGTKVVTKSDTTGLSDKLINRIHAIFKAANESIDSFLNVNVADLSPDQILKGKTQLGNLFKSYNNYQRNAGKFKDDLIEQARVYYELIPTKLGHKIDALNVAINLGKNAADEEDKLEQLEAAYASYKVSVSGGSLLDQVGCILSEVSTDEFQFAKKYFEETKRHAEHKHLTVKEVWKVEIPQERKYFLDFPKKDNIKTLWHGTAERNVKHILHKKGLIIPSYASNGSMYGRGIYFADVCTKSINYCGYSKEKYLFLTDVVLGKQYKTNNTLNWTKCQNGYDSVFAGSDKPMTGAYAGSLRFNEYIVYKPEQQTIKYLLVIE